VGKTRRHELKLGLLRKVVQAARGSVSRVPAKWTSMPGAAVKIGGARGRPASGGPTLLRRWPAGGVGHHPVSPLCSALVTLSIAVKYLPSAASPPSGPAASRGNASTQAYASSGRPSHPFPLPAHCPSIQYLGVAFEHAPGRYGHSGHCYEIWVSFNLLMHGLFSSIDVTTN
jgi:hypothetical protein